MSEYSASRVSERPEYDLPSEHPWHTRRMDRIWQVLPQKHKDTIEKVYIRREKAKYLELERLHHLIAGALMVL